MASKAYYDEYWKGDLAAPDADPTNAARIRVLRRETMGARRILDVGCGSGIFARAVKADGNEVVGVDISARAVARARKASKGVRFVAGDAQNAGFMKRLGTFDVAYCLDVVEHVFDTKALVSNIAAAAKPGGRVIIGTPSHGLIKRLATAILKHDRHYDVEGPHIRFYTEQALKSQMERAGIRPVRTHHVGRFWPFRRDMLVVGVKE